MNARDITVYSESVNNSGLEPELKRALIAARRLVDTAGLSKTDEADVNDSLGRITTELEKPNRDPGLIRRYFNRIKDVAAGVAGALESAKIIKDVIDMTT
jgi:hypothetical protein